MMYSYLKHIHSGLRWILLLFLIMSVLMAIVHRVRKTHFKKGLISAPLLTVYFTHLQFITGIILYFISPKVVFRVESMKSPDLRFFLLEHSLLMLIAIILITAGYSLSKKSGKPAVSSNRLLIFYGTALAIILLAIPWPFRGFGSGWI